MTGHGRGCSTDTGCILDGEENDACEVLHLLVGIITDELHEHFQEHQSPALCGQTALQDILGFHRSRCSSPGTAEDSADTTDQSVPAEAGAERRSPRLDFREPSCGITLQPGSAGLADHGNALGDPDMSAAESSLLEAHSRSVNTCAGDSRSQGTARGISNADKDNWVSPAHVRVHATQQAEPILAAWRACRSPLELSQTQEIACLVCRRHTSTTMSTAVALPLVLPAVKVCMRKGYAEQACERSFLHLAVNTLEFGRHCDCFWVVENAVAVRPCL